MYEKQNTLYEEIVTLLSECLSVQLFHRFVESMDTYNIAYLQVLAQMVMYYCDVDTLSYIPVEYLIPEFVAFKTVAETMTTRRKVLFISNPGLARFLFTRPDFNLSKNMEKMKRKKFDDIFKRIEEPKDFSSVQAITNKLTVIQRAQIVEMLSKLIVVANHISQHYTQFVTGKEIDYDHDTQPQYFNLERLITNEPSKTIRDYLRKV